MASTIAFKEGITHDFGLRLNRAKAFFRSIVQHGYIREDDHQAPVRLQNPDRRDAAQFIFFELAASFEDFALNAFLVETRHRFHVNPARAKFIMGSIDNGLSGVMGWASPSKLQARGRNLFGRNGFFGRLEENISPQTYDILTRAHKVRNRIAHQGGKAIEDFVAILGVCGVPAGARQGVGPGRLLVDYPVGAPPFERNFYRFANAYEQFLTVLKAAEPMVP